LTILAEPETEVSKTISNEWRMITVERIGCREALAAIESEWTAFIDRAPDATPFHRPQWLLPWWREFGSGELHALAFRSDSRLVGFIGLFIHNWTDRR
jgi:CelD/BcsL family acetyltransferase involved in cellulose biosynthesis